MTESIIVIDFETTGLSPTNGDRTTEVAAVKVQGDRIVDTFQSLMNPGVRVPTHIEQLTGITNAMLKDAPSSRVVMAHLSAFLGNNPLAAHNARFDECFLHTELALAGIQLRPKFVCTMKLARRVYPNAPNHKLLSLLAYADIAHQGRLHRALADAKSTALLLLQMQRDMRTVHGIPHLDFARLKALENAPRSQIDGILKSFR